MQNKHPEGGCSGYHHGDLRNALIIAAAELIEENGSVEFAMVDAARRAGVSSAAPYRHFKDKDALLEAVTQLGFLALTESTLKIAETFPKKDADCIIGLGQVYIDFVTRHPAFYDLMWGDFGLRAMDTDTAELQTSGFYVLVDTVQGWCDSNGLSDQSARELSVKLWAMAHGLACLAMNHHMEKFMPGVELDSLMESSARTFLDGLLRVN